MKILFVDDDKSRREIFAEWFPDAHFATSYDEAIILILEGGYHFIFLDHDLGFSSKDGTAIAKFIAEEFITPMCVIIHSWSNAGANSMIGYFKDAQIPYVYAPFGVDLRKFIEANRKELMCRN